MRNLNHYTILADVFKYPEKGRNKSLSGLTEIVSKLAPKMTPKVQPFVVHIEQKPISEQQEYYIATFDVQALCFLDIGYVLYGEDYNRGVFLVNMKNEQEKAGVDCGSELPDHLPNILTLLPRFQDEKIAEEMICSILIPALEKMIESFNSNDNVYKGMLKVLMKIMENDFPESDFERFNFSSQEKAKSFECLPQWRNIK